MEPPLRLTNKPQVESWKWSSRVEVGQKPAWVDCQKTRSRGDADPLFQRDLPDSPVLKESSIPVKTGPV